MNTTNYFYRACVLLLLIFSTYSCEDEFQQYSTIVYQTCEDENVVTDPNIISDFECQANMILTDVETLRNPAEIQINTSKFVGKLIDGPEAWDALVIDYGTPIDFSTHAVFKIKVRTEVEGTLKVKLEGGTSAPVEKDNVIAGDNGWAEYSFNFSDQEEENHTKLVLFFNAGVENGGNDVYYIDDLYFDLIIDPCDGVIEDLFTISDFECQQNYFLGDPDDETAVSVVENPYKSGINESDFVGEYTDDGLNAWDNLLIDFGSEIDLSNNSQLKIKIYSAITVPLLAKLEGGDQMEIWGSIDQVNEWVEYTFDFRDAIGKGNTKVVLFFNGGQSNGTSTDVYYIDDLEFDAWTDPCENVVADLSVISDFECQQNYFLGNPDDETAASVVDNPNKSGENTSDFAGEYTDDGLNAWDNLLIDFGAEIDLSENPRFNIKIHSSKTVPLLAKLEGGTQMEIWGNIDTVGEWKNYSFDFSAAIGNGNTKVVLFFNGGQSDGTAADVYYIDDLQFLPADCGEIIEDCSSATPDMTIISDFDCQQNYHLGVDTDVDDVAVVSNPYISCGNRSSNVGEYIDNGKDAWDNLQIIFDEPIDLSTHNQLKLKIYSQKSIQVLAKLEGGTANEVWSSFSAIGEWQEFTYDFSESAGDGNTKIVLFINGGQSDGTDQDTYYIDDIRFETP